ncbi:hypothetical protein ZIOFF_008792 [Zingiber officinale]|uniref:NAC domain-containing protein n=2 Tax=Zingiber officinale TaxID=94328 RepID=A0A8J5IGX1_ZINOF|nr:hypothetical protein ZIOFF_008792 [Zingiber officinale]
MVNLDGVGLKMAVELRRKRRDAEAELNLPPGFRFHPTDDELILHYLCLKVASKRLPVPIIAEVDLYKFDPWELPEMALFGEKEWYFFTPRDRKYPNGSRPNRAAGKGYWKATGADKPISKKGCCRTVGIKKALVFYSGKAPRGVKTDWIMHEYRLADADRSPKNGSLKLDAWVLCRLYNKKNTRGKMLQPQEETSTVDSVDRTPESEVDNDALLPDVNGLAFPSVASQAFAPPVIEKSWVKEEDSRWFMDLELDDLQCSCMRFGASPVLDLTNQDYYFQFNATTPVPIAAKTLQF